MTASISARTIDALTAIATAVHDLAAAVRETGRAGEGRIDAQEPAGQPEGGSGGRGASGGLGERLRAEAEAGRVGQHARLSAIADDVDELEAAYRVADAEIARLSEFHDHYRAQLEAIRAAIAREAAHGEAITRCNLVAERFQTVLDGTAVDACGAKSEPFLIRDSDQKPIHYLVKTCRLPAGHGRPHHWPVLTFVTPGFTEEA